jgi:hypothetical protein
MRWKRFVDWSWCENMVALVICGGVIFLSDQPATAHLWGSGLWMTAKIASGVWLALRFIDLMIYGPQRRERDRTRAALMQGVMYRRD